MVGLRRPSLSSIMFLILFPWTRDARAEVPSPSLSLPSRLTLDRALEIARTRGLEVLGAAARVRSAGGDVAIAGAAPNPALTLGYGRVLGYDPSSSGQDTNQYTAGLSDQGAIEDSLSGKRSLRLDVARSALAASKLGRQDALRVIGSQVKQRYVAVAEATEQLEFAQAVVDAATTTLELSRHRYPQVIDEGALSRIETQKLETDQARDQALQALRVARLGLAFLLGVRQQVPDFEVDTAALGYRVPAALATVTEAGLLRTAMEHRPDLSEQGYERARAAAAIELAKRERFPDVALSAQYTQTGTGQNAIQPPTLGFAVTAPLPLFYQQQGEIEKANADYDDQSLTLAKLAAQVVSDVGTAFAGFVSARQLVERMQGGLLASAKRARDVTEVQFKAGAGTLIDFLDAERTYVATNVEYLQDLTTYWTAVYQLEQAVGMEFE
jgi:cobalt-zinc-cadmium efflux system outer membrane protein